MTAGFFGFLSTPGLAALEETKNPLFLLPPIALYESKEALKRDRNRVSG